MSAIILAAGKGLRMNSPLPKVLHPVAGEAMLARVARQLSFCKNTHVVVPPSTRRLIEATLAPYDATLHEQKEPKGTADALKSVDMKALGEGVLILNGDHPLIEEEQLKSMMKSFQEGDLDVLVATFVTEAPEGLGRVVRDAQGRICQIVEQAELTQDQTAINEINTGIYFIKTKVLEEILQKLDRYSSKGELYLTDMISFCYEASYKVDTFPASPEMAFGVNSPQQLAQATRHVFQAQAQHHLQEGVIIIDPQNTYIEPFVQIGKACVIYPGCYIKKGTRMGPFCVLEMNTYLHAAQLGNSVQVRAFSYLENCKVESNACVGPFARLREGVHLEEDVKVGNFVELKNSHVKKGAKANHMSYIGDSVVGERSNLGAGTVTCNYSVDRKKYKTHLGSDVFVGSGVQFVAPVKVGDAAVIGAGSTVRSEVKSGSLFVTSGKKITKENYKPDSTTQS